MRLSSALPLILLPTLSLAHGHRTPRSAHRRHLAHGQSRWDKRVPDLLDDLSGDETTSSATLSVASTTGADETTTAAHSTSLAVTSAASTAVATTSTAAITTSSDQATTTTAAASTSAVAATSNSEQTSDTTRAVSSNVKTSAVSASAAMSATSTSNSVATSSNAVHSASSTLSSFVTSQSQAGPSSVSRTTTADSSSSASSATQSAQYTTDSDGQTQLVTVILTESAAASDTASTATSSASSTSSSSSGGDNFPTGAIIGICVAVGVAIVGLIAFAIIRMRRRSGDDDEAIRWPELNRHGDSDAHHALPARETGKHGFETSLERSLSNHSSVHYAEYPTNEYIMPSSLSPPPMALNGSSFGASSSLEDQYAMNEKYSTPPSPQPPSHDDHDNYTSFPPPLQPQPLAYGSGVMYDHTPSPAQEDLCGGDVQMTQLSNGVTYHSTGVTSPGPGDYPRYDYPLHGSHRFE